MFPSQVQDALRKEGLESSNLVLAIDYTGSNEWTGKNSFGGRCLHALGQESNPYELAISIIGRTLAAFDEDNLIPAYGFGDVGSKDSRVFSFHEGDQPCHGLDSVLWRYKEVTPYVKLSGPTSFAPAIYQASCSPEQGTASGSAAAMQIVARQGGQFHILEVVADGQVTRPSGMPSSQLSVQEQATVDAIVAASSLPLSIIMVARPEHTAWALVASWCDSKLCLVRLQEFDDKLPKRQFDNFQFVNFTEVQRKYGSHPKLEAQFALQALMELPEQYKLIQSMGMLSRPVNQRIPGYPPMNPPAPSRWGPAGPAGDAAGSSSVPVAMGQPVPYYQQPSMGPGLAGSQYPSMHRT
ncbi:hypothetical protein QJQ45_001725 [Haematococcus lacustris]|nr:hypothetical protein QJQ45_001725 [Haematococcus lacustris]